MVKDKVVVGIDVGTAKIATLIASIPPEGQAHVIGVSTVASRGLRKGQIVDIEEATGAIISSLEAAERMAGYQVNNAFISIGGGHIQSQNSRGVVAVSEPNREISLSDIQRVIDAAKAVSLPSSREIIHVLPRQFTVDSQDGIKDPIGMTGVRLEVDTHIVTGGVTALRNLEKCLSEVGVDVSGFVFAGIASSTAVLTETEKELGVVIIDIGSGTTDICVFVEGALSYSSVIPIGARNITNDLAIGLRLSLESAEKIKLFLGEEKKEITYPEESPAEKGIKMKKEKKDEDEIDLSTLHLPEEVNKVSKRTLIEGIIRPRLNEIFTMIGLDIKKSGFAGVTPAGIVVTGGGSRTVGLIEAAKRNLAMPVRIGMPTQVTGLIDEVINPSFATSVGLILYGSKNAQRVQSTPTFTRLASITKNLPIKGVAGKIANLVKSFLP